MLYYSIFSLKGVQRYDKKLNDLKKNFTKNKKTFSLYLPIYINMLFFNILDIFNVNIFKIIYYFFNIFLSIQHKIALAISNLTFLLIKNTSLFLNIY